MTKYSMRLLPCLARWSMLMLSRQYSRVVVKVMSSPAIGRPHRPHYPPRKSTSCGRRIKVGFTATARRGATYTIHETLSTICSSGRRSKNAETAKHCAVHGGPTVLCTMNPPCPAQCLFKAYQPDTSSESADAAWRGH